MSFYLAEYYFEFELARYCIVPAAALSFLLYLIFTKKVGKKPASEWLPHFLRGIRSTLESSDVKSEKLEVENWLFVDSFFQRTKYLLRAQFYIITTLMLCFILCIVAVTINRYADFSESQTVLCDIDQKYEQGRYQYLHINECSERMGMHKITVKRHRTGSNRPLSEQNSVKLYLMSGALGEKWVKGVGEIY